MLISVKPAEECKYDIVSLGEIMIRLDPGDERIHTTRHFRAWEGGGEYNVARGLKRCFGKRAAVVTAIADNPIGRLLQDMIFQGCPIQEVFILGRDVRRHPLRVQELIDGAVLAVPVPFGQIDPVVFAGKEAVHHRKIGQLVPFEDRSGSRDQGLGHGVDADVFCHRQIELFGQ